MCSMKVHEFAATILAMLVPFMVIKTDDLSTYIYWTAVVSLYLIYTAFRRWEIE